MIFTFGGALICLCSRRCWRVLREFVGRTFSVKRPVYKKHMNKIREKKRVQFEFFVWILHAFSLGNGKKKLQGNGKFDNAKQKITYNAVNCDENLGFSKCPNTKATHILVLCLTTVPQLQRRANLL